MWRQPVGGGYAGVTVAGGRVFTMDFHTGAERVLAFDAATGKPLWSHSYPVKYGDLGGYGNGPRCSPNIDGDSVFTLGPLGHALCLEAATGKVVWQRDTVKEFGAKVPEWGFAASPVIDRGRVLLHVGAKDNGCILALDRGTGKEVWRSLPDPAGYCTPLVIDAPSGRQVVVWTPENLHGIDADTGRPLWKVPHKITYGVSIASPVYREDTVFVTEYWTGAVAVKLGAKPTDFAVLWENKTTLRGLMAQPLHRAGHGYSIDRGFGLTGFDFRTGKKLWDDDNRLTPKARNPHASIVWLGDTDRVLALNAVGELVLARLTPKGYEEESRTKAVNGRVWGHPAFAGRFVFAKTDGGEAWRNAGPHELVCVELADK